MPITESGITLNFPDNNYFRLGGCDGYKKIGKEALSPRMKLARALVSDGHGNQDNTL